LEFISMGQHIDLQAADNFRLPAYRAQPEGRPSGGVVILQEIFGVNAHIRSMVDRYAEAGYLAVAPATFHRVQAGVDLGYQAEDRKAGVALKAAVEALGQNPQAGGALADTQAAVDYAAQAGKVAVIGYCWGGLLAWRAACLLRGVSASVTYYGGGMTTEAEIARRPRCPVLAHFGNEDESIPLPTVHTFAQAHPEVALHIYAAHHGFNCDHRSAWNPSAAQLAWERTQAFLTQHLV
jgi:carboxymethylenebutenolidase